MNLSEKIFTKEELLEGIDNSMLLKLNDSIKNSIKSKFEDDYEDVKSDDTASKQAYFSKDNNAKRYSYIVIDTLRDIVLMLKKKKDFNISLPEDFKKDSLDVIDASKVNAELQVILNWLDNKADALNN